MLGLHRGLHALLSPGGRRAPRSSSSTWSAGTCTRTGSPAEFTGTEGYPHRWTYDRHRAASQRHHQRHEGREKERVGALRLVLSELQKAEKEGGDDELAVLRRERKRRLDAAAQFRDGGRPELADRRSPRPS